MVLQRWILSGCRVSVEVVKLYWWHITFPSTALCAYEACRNSF